MAKLYFYYSAMNAGKSTTLLQASYNYQERGMQTLLFSPGIDNRHKLGYISSRIGLNAEANLFTPKVNLLEYVKAFLKQKRELKCVLIDEAQFLTKKQVLQLTVIVDRLNIPVLCYGLRSDFRAESFEGSLYLLIWADEINEIKTICYCGRKAIMNIRFDAENRKITKGKQIEIGGNERYLAVCRKHFKLADSSKCR
jgi:thymidine kinase